MLGEFFAAPASAIDDALIENGPLGRYETVSAKTVHAVSIAILGGSLAGLAQKAVVSDDEIWFWWSL